jgi:multicomponent Na+:H+ antiporter subunit D
VALLASVLTLGYFLILQRNLFFGKPGESMEKVTESNKGIISAEILLSAVTLAVGVLFPLVLLFVQSKGLI